MTSGGVVVGVPNPRAVEDIWRRVAEWMIEQETVPQVTDAEVEMIGAGKMIYAIEPVIVIDGVIVS